MPLLSNLDVEVLYKTNYVFDKLFELTVFFRFVIFDSVTIEDWSNFKVLLLYTEAWPSLLND